MKSMTEELIPCEQGEWGFQTMERICRSDPHFEIFALMKTTEEAETESSLAS